MKKANLLLSTMLVGVSSLTTVQAQTARLEVIHNASDAVASVVDVYVNGGATPFIDDFAFRTTSGFIDVPAGVDLNIGIALATSTGPGDILFTLPAVNLIDGETYIAIANGIVSGTGYMPNSTITPFGLDIYDQAREGAASQGMNETDVLVYHGSTDAPTVDVFESGAISATIVDDISYSEFQGYLELGTSNYELTIQDETGAVNVASFDAPLQTLMLEDAAITVLASGFFDPSMNSGGAMFGLWVSLGTGGDLIPLSNVTGVNVEVIKNASLYPNPANDNATMFFDLEDETNIFLEVVNTMGQRVVLKSFGQMSPGNHRVEIPASQMAPGFYFINLTTDSGVVSTRMQVLR